MDDVTSGSRPLSSIGGAGCDGQMMDVSSQVSDTEVASGDVPTDLGALGFICHVYNHGTCTGGYQSEVGSRTPFRGRKGHPMVATAAPRLTIFLYIESLPADISYVLLKRSMDALDAIDEVHPASQNKTRPFQ